MEDTTFIVLFCCISVASCTVSEVTIQSSFGELIGLLDDEVRFGDESRSGLRFLGIPFAKPPVGSLRFKKSEPITNLSATHNATFFGNVCPQIGIIPSNTIARMSEDCLYLNIFTPGDLIFQTKSFAVLIWVHGGAFIQGHADIFFGDVLSSFNDVIFVTFNYRLNVLGFLDDGSGEFANNGLHDQKLVVDWVHNHIGSFGGDPERVTLVGQSAGAASAMYQALNPENEGQIHRIISQSGTILGDWAYQSNPRSVFDVYVKDLDCDRESINETIYCLQTKSVDDLLGALKLAMTFLPTVDGLFLEMDPSTLFLNYSGTSSLERFFNIDFLTGFNDKDGASLTLLNWLSVLIQARIHFEEGVPFDFFKSVYIPSFLNNTTNDHTLNALTKSVVHTYIDWQDPENTTKIRDSMIDVTTDTLFLVAAVRAAKAHATEATPRSTYMYQFSNVNNSWSPSWLNGADHSSEIPYVLGLSEFLLSTSIEFSQKRGFNVQQSDAAIELSRAVMKYWTNFAKTGNPNSMESRQSGYPTWPPFSPESQAYIDLTADLSPSSIRQRPQSARVNFWIDVVPALRNSCFGKKCEGCQTSSGEILGVPFTFISSFVLVLSLVEYF